MLEAVPRKGLEHVNVIIGTGQQVRRSSALAVSMSSCGRSMVHVRHSSDNYTEGTWVSCSCTHNLPTSYGTSASSRNAVVLAMMCAVSCCLWQLPAARLLLLRKVPLHVPMKTIMKMIPK